MKRRKNRWLTIVAALASALALGACDDGSGSGDDAGAAETDGGAAETDGGGTTRPSSAVLIAERFNTPDGRVGYMGVFEELPSEPIVTSQLFELPSTGKVIGCGENVLQYDGDSSTITRYLVGDDLSLTEDASVIVSTEGVEGFSAAFLCVSPTQAYLFSRDATRGVEFNPETMVIVDAFDLPAPDLDPGLTPGIFEPSRFGDLVYFPVEAVDYETFAYNTRAIVAVFDLTDESWTYTYLDGCSSGNGASVASDGTFYREPLFYSFFVEYTEQAETVPDCLARIPAGARELDSGFSVDPGPVVNSYPIDDQYFLALRVAPSATLPPREDAFDWFGLDVVPTRIDRATGDEQPYPGLGSRSPTNSRRIELDGRRLYQVEEVNAEGNLERTVAVELLPDGPSDPLFVVEGGDILTLERLW